MISKNKAPAIHFVIQHPKMPNAFENFVAPHKEPEVHLKKEKGHSFRNAPSMQSLSLPLTLLSLPGSDHPSCFR